VKQILIVADRTDDLKDLAQTLGREKDIEIRWVHDAQNALESIAAEAPDLVVVDETVGGRSGLDWIRRLIEVNAFVQTAAVSGLPHEAFHEAAEGLGVMVQLPPRPLPPDATRLLHTWRQHA
jgi:DNA-binding NtrC family response regulator